MEINIAMKGVMDTIGPSVRYVLEALLKEKWMEIALSETDCVERAIRQIMFTWWTDNSFFSLPSPTVTWEGEQGLWWWERLRRGFGLLFEYMNL